MRKRERREGEGEREERGREREERESLGAEEAVASSTSFFLSTSRQTPKPDEDSPPARPHRATTTTQPAPRYTRRAHKQVLGCRRGLQLARLGVASLCWALPVAQRAHIVQWRIHHRRICHALRQNALPSWRPPTTNSVAVFRVSAPPTGWPGAHFAAPRTPRGENGPAALAGHFWGTRLPRWSASA